MDAIGVFTPEQARLLWQEYQNRKQLEPHVQHNYPQRRSIDEVSPHRVFVKNSEDETIPPYACMRITGTQVIGGRTALTVEKPTSTSGEFVFNSQYEIEASGNGWAYRFGIVVMLGDAPSAAGVSYLPIVASWEIEEGAGPFVVFGEHNATVRALIGRFAGGTTDIEDGIVSERLGCGRYMIELGTLEDCGPLGSASESGSGDNCDPCLDHTGSGSAGCGITLPIPPNRVIGNGTFVEAYDPASVHIELVIDSDCVVARVAAGCVDGSGSGSGSGGDTPLDWRVIRGYQEHIVQYKEDGECCPTTGVWQTTRKMPIILIGHECDWVACEPCPPEGSGS